MAAFDISVRETRTRLVQFVLSLGLYFSGYAASYALVNLASKYSVVNFIAPALGCFLPLSWTITMWRHSDEARLAPAQLVAVAVAGVAQAVVPGVIPGLAGRATRQLPHGLLAQRQPGRSCLRKWR